MNSDIQKYVANAREQHVSDAEIKDALLKGGWKEKDITLALTPHPATDSSLPPPPPPPVEHFGMWVTFEYVILFISLYVSASAIAGIFNIMVDNLIPDTLSLTRSLYYSSGDAYSSLMRGYIAALIVAFPIFAYLFYSLGKQTRQKPSIRNLHERKILIYFTMVVTFVIMLIHLIIIIYSFLEGAVTGRALGHLLVTLLVAGSIFGSLLYLVKEDRKLN